MIKDRVIQLIEFKRVKKEEFFPKIGMTSANFRGSAKSTPLNSTAIENILSIFTDVSPEWLISGNGPMLRSEITVVKNSECDLKPGIPLIPLSAFAGLPEGEVQVLEIDCERYVIPVFKDAQFLIPIKGESMEPKLCSGDIVACKKLSLNDIFFQWNKIYVFDTDQGVLVKRVKKSTTPDHVVLVSDNSNYEPFELPLSRIYSIALVIGVVHLE